MLLGEVAMLPRFFRRKGVKLIYLDNSGTTKQYAEVTEEMLQVMENDYGNPSSLHRLGLSAEKLVKRARREVADSLGASPEEIYFTSGGTESDNSAILGAAYSRRRSGNKIITVKTEHPAVLESCRRLERDGFHLVYLAVDQEGVVDLHQLKSELDQQTILLSIMHVNNEVGTLQPVSEIFNIKSDWNEKNKRDVLLHVDAVQSYGKFDLSNLSADLVSLSGHKVHGPKGIGALYIKKGVCIDPMMVGGGQERGQRSGTENVPAIAGFGVAASLINRDRGKTAKRMAELKDRLASRIGAEIKDVRFNGGAGATASPAILNVSFLGIRGEVLLHSLEQEGIYVSTGSACASNKKGQSHVLKAMGLSSQEIEGAIRFSLGAFNTLEEIDITVDKLAAAVQKMRRLGSFR